MNVIEVSDLRKRYGDRLAVDGVSFSVEEGEIFGILEATIKTRLLHIYAKLDVGDRAAAVAVAYDRGLLTPKRP